MPQRRGRVGVLSESFRIPLAQNFHHPFVEVIDGMVLNRTETPVVLFAGLIEIGSESDTDVFVFAPKTNVLGPQKFDVLHGHFGHAIGAAMQLLLIRRKAGDVKGRSFDCGLRFGSDFGLRLNCRRRRLNNSDAGRSLRARCACFLCGLGPLGLGRFLFGFDLRFSDSCGCGCRIFVGALAIARLERHRHEIGKYREARCKRGRSGLGAKHCRKGVARAARRAGRDKVGVGLLKLVGGPLERDEIIAQGPGNGLFQSLFERSLALFHACFQGIPRYQAIMETLLGGVN